MRSIGGPSLVFLYFFLFMAASRAEDVIISPRAAIEVAKVTSAYEQVRTRQSKMPAPANTREILERLQDLDQAGRTALGKVDLNSLTKEEAEVVIQAVNRELDAHDLRNQQRLKELMPPEGWFRVSVYGAKAESAAFLIVQHAVNDPAFMHSVLAKMKDFVAEGEAPGGEYALLYDRVSLEFDNKAQKFGTQLKCVSGTWRPDNVEDPDRLNERRKLIGLQETEEEYQENFKGFPCK